MFALRPGTLLTAVVLGVLVLAGGGPASAKTAVDTTGPNIVMQPTGHIVVKSPVTCWPGWCTFDALGDQVYMTTAQVRWSVSDPSGVCDSQVWSVSGRDAPLLMADVGKATTYNLPSGDIDGSDGGYNQTRVMVRSMDCAGNWSSSGVDPCNSIVDPTCPIPPSDRFLGLPLNLNGLTSYDDSAATYSPNGWTHSTGAVFMGGSDIHAVTAGATMTYTYTGEVFAWVSEYGPARGSAKVYQDGILKATVSLYAKANTGPEIAWSNWFPVSGPHTIKIVVLGTAGHPRVDVDGFFTGPTS